MLLSDTDADFASAHATKANNLHASTLRVPNPKSLDAEYPTAGSTVNVDALVVGASWAGIWILHLLRRQGLNVQLVDACSDLGGVWYYTRYPGCRVDTEVPLYEFSDPDLWQNWNWTERFPSRVEIHRYLTWVCERLDLKRLMSFNTRIIGAEWGEERQKWNITSLNGTSYQARFFLPCSGYSTIRYIPRFPGIESFPLSFHSSEWPENLDCTNKRVGVVGNAASGIQIIESLGAKVKHLTVFQRTPNFATPMRQEVFTHESLAKLKAEYPSRFANRLSRTGFDKPSARNTFDDDTKERQSFYETLWQRGGLSFWLGNYKDLLTSRAANAEAYAFWRQKVLARVSNKSAAEKLAPLKAPHAFGAKRPSLENRYFETFNQPNVKLVDVKEEPVTGITRQGVQTTTGLYELDVLVFATGFDSITGSILAMGVKGIDGLSLNERWDVKEGGTGVHTYLGLMTKGFPNMFFAMGPQAPSPLGLTPHLSEIQDKWISDCIRYMVNQGYSKIEPTESAELAWKKEVEAGVRETLIGEADSWYMGTNIPNRRKEALCYFGGVDKYAKAIMQAATNGYTGFVFS